MELYQGDLLEGVYLRDAFRFEEWLSFERQRLRGIYQTGMEERLANHRRQGDSAAVVADAQNLLKLDPLREDWHYSLIEAYGQLGLRAAAMDQYKKCRQMLLKEWGTEPAPETTALFEAIQSKPIGGEIPARENIPLEISGFANTGGMENPDMHSREGQEEPTKNGNGSKAGKAVTNIMPGMAKAGWIGIPALALIGVVLFILVWVFGGGSRLRQVLGMRPPAADEASLAASPDPDLAGKKVWILGPFRDEQAKLFVKSLAPFEEKSGIDIIFITGDQTYDLDLETRVESGDLPDIIVLPQPGWLQRLKEKGKIIDLGTFLEMDYLRQQYPEAFLSLVSVDGRVMGLWHTVGLKSLVWYPKKAFEENGYKVPVTWEEMIALSDQIVADGGKPWCIGMDDLEAKGWVGTDWIEDILLRTAPPETYDAWVNHQLPFDSVEIRRAFEIMGQIWLNEAYVYGSKEKILSESFDDSLAHLFIDPPECYLHRQATFAKFFFPESMNFGEDYDFFFLPPIDAEYGKPVLGSGEIFAMFNDRPEVREVIRYLTTVEATKPQIENGGFLSPHRSTPIEWFPSEADLRFAQILVGADTYRFDASDLMPPEVGLGSFFRGITAWVEGAELDTVLKEIDASWSEKE